MRSVGQRSPFYLITGLLIGLTIGLIYTWVYSPVEQLKTEPNSLRADFKDTYRSLIASAYLVNSDLGRAEARLILLQDDDPERALTIQAQRVLGEEGAEMIARALGILAADIGNGIFELPAEPQTSTPNPTKTQLITPTITMTPRPSSTAMITATPLASHTPTATVGAAFLLQNYSLVCEEIYKESPLIMVNVYDAANTPVPGKEVMASWDQGQDSFFTGLKIEFGLGYADFEMLPGIAYTISMADGGENLPGLTALECENDDSDRWLGSWIVNFVQP